MTCLFPLALAQFCELKPDQWLACVTDEAAETHYYRSLEAELQVQPVRIPWGKDSEELWQIFDRVVEAINPREQVVFDITHGFRSFPVIVLLAAAYLKPAKGIDLQGIFYAAAGAGG